MAKKQIKVLQLLNSKHFISGQEIARQLAISRTRVWQLIQQLQHSGLEIHAIRGKGYALQKKVTLLDKKKILSIVKPKNLHLDIEPLLDSTSKQLQKKAKSHAPDGFLFAEIQTAGRGRRGKNWQSNFGGALTFSWLRSFNLPVQRLSGLSLVAGLAVARALAEFHIKVQLKWPNDLYLQNKKLGGILIDLINDKQQVRVVTGIGINIQLEEKIKEKIDQQVIDLCSVNAELQQQRNEIAARIIQSLLDYYQQFEQQGLSAFLDQWQQHDLLYGKTVRIEQQGEHYQAIAKGITADGALKILLRGQERLLYSGEVSLKLATDQARLRSKMT